MANELSKTQVDRLGDRLRQGVFTETDLRALDDYRRSFGPAYETVVGIVRKELRLEPAGRPAKSTTSIIEKLRRESIRLTQVQDIAGCRVVVAGVIEQDEIVATAGAVFPTTTVIDRRMNTSYGYRAVHLVVRVSARLVEIQVRTTLQHLWAEFSEKLSDLSDASVKYGGGDEDVRDLLLSASRTVATVEDLELRVTRSATVDADLKARLDALRGRLTGPDAEVARDLRRRIDRLSRQSRHRRQRVLEYKNNLREILSEGIAHATSQRSET